MAAQTFTAAQIIADVEDRLRNTEYQYSATVMLDWLNDAIRYIHGLLVEERKELVGRSTGTITLADGTETYDLTSNSMEDLWTIHKIYVDDGTNYYLPLEQCDEDLRYQYLVGTAPTEGRPMFFYIESDNVGFLPVPDAAYTAHVTYYANWVPLASAAADMPFKSLYDTAIKEAMELRARHTDQQPGAFEAQMQQILMRRHMQIASQRNHRTHQFNVKSGMSQGY